MLNRTIFRLLLAVGLSLLLVGLVAAQEDEPGEPYAEFNISLEGYSFVVEGLEAGAPLELEAGELYELHFTNNSDMEHEVLFGRDAIVTDATNNWHLDYETSLLGDVETEISGEMNDEDFAIGVSGFIELELNPGQEFTISFTLPEDKVGDWEMGCFVFSDPNATDENPGITHYDLGMKLPIVVIEGM